jgi:RimJ/RimL family protein N-acetyltransferase
MDTPPDRIELPEMVLRPWSEKDAPALQTAISESFETLHPWLPWAAHPPVLADQEGFIATSRQEWALGKSFGYGIFDPSGEQVYGAIGLHTRIAPGGLDVGYWLHRAHTGRGLMTSATSVITREAFALSGIDRAEIHVDEANTASAAIPRRLGYRLDRIEDHEITAPAETGRRMIWVRTRTI